jgi:hypothetical protein
MDSSSLLHNGQVGLMGFFFITAKWASWIDWILLHYLTMGKFD